MLRAKRVWAGIVAMFVIVFAVLTYEAHRPDKDEFWSVAVPGLLTGTGTLALAVATVVLATQERHRNDSLLLEAAAKEELRVKYEQAEQVSAWLSGQPQETERTEDRSGLYVNLSKASEQLVYEVVVFQVFLTGATHPKTGEEWPKSEKRRYAYAVLRSLPPGRSSVSLPGSDYAMTARPGVEIAFTDRSGNHWVRRSMGVLEELPTNAIDYYDLYRPALYTYTQSELTDPQIGIDRWYPRYQTHEAANPEEDPNPIRYEVAEVSGRITVLREAIARAQSRRVLRRRRQ